MDSITVKPNCYKKVGFCRIDFNKKFEFVSESFAELLGKNAGQMIGDFVVEHTAQEDRLETEKRLNDLISGAIDRVSTEKRYTTPSGQRKWCMLESVRHDDHMVSIIYEIAEGDVIDQVGQLKLALATLKDSVLQREKDLHVNFHQGDNVGQDKTGRDKTSNSTEFMKYLMPVLVAICAALAYIAYTNATDNPEPPSIQTPLTE